jgi:hypothetical protein
MYNDESFNALFNKANDDIQNHSFGYKDGPLQTLIFSFALVKKSPKWCQGSWNWKEAEVCKEM